MIHRGLSAAALGVLVASGCATAGGSSPVPLSAVVQAAPVSPVVPPVAAPSRADRLIAQLDRVLADQALARATTAFVVRSLATKETLYRRNGQTWLVPASTQKLLTAVAAADRLGWGYRFETRLVATGPVVDGTLEGDLLVIGGGDPTINQRHGPRAAAFDDWARALKAQGLRHIAGHVVGDDHNVEEPGWGIGWAWDDLAVGYGSAYGALQYAENEVDVTMAPGLTPGAPAVVYLSPANHGLLVDNRAVTSAEGSSPSLQIARVPGTRFLTVDGRSPLGSAAVSESVAVASPTLYYTSELRATLMRHGIVVDAGATAPRCSGSAIPERAGIDGLVGDGDVDRAAAPAADTHLLRHVGRVHARGEDVAALGADVVVAPVAVEDRPVGVLLDGGSAVLRHLALANLPHGDGRHGLRALRACRRSR